MSIELPSPIYSPSKLHSARILRDSSFGGNRLTTFEIMFPRCVLAEFNTHRMLSRNSASSRAIPVKKMIDMVLNRGYVPWHWGKNQKGMQADDVVDEDMIRASEEEWKDAAEHAVLHSKRLREYGIHKQITNRLLEPFMLHTVIVSATQYSNFFNLRCHEAAHPDIRAVAMLMMELYDQELPNVVVNPAEHWHLPLVSREEEDNMDLNDLIKISVGRCARVSYLTHDGKRDVDADIALYDRLLESGHMSPFEHVARPATYEDSGTARFERKDLFLSRNLYPGLSTLCVAPSAQWHGNFKGWVQHRKEVLGEEDMLQAD